MLLVTDGGFLCRFLLITYHIYVSDVIASLPKQPMLKHFKPSIRFVPMHYVRLALPLVRTRLRFNLKILIDLLFGQVKMRVLLPALVLGYILPFEFFS